MPQITDQEKLQRDFILELVSKGPLDGTWRAQFLKCPLCGYYVLKGDGYDECPCGNIAVDSDALRVSVRSTPESEVETYNARPRRTASRQPGRSNAAVGTLFGRDVLRPSYHRGPTYDSLSGSEPRYQFHCIACGTAVTLDLIGFLGSAGDERILGESAVEEVRAHFGFNAVGKSHEGGWPQLCIESCGACGRRYLVYVGVQEPANGAYRITVQGISELNV